MLTLTGSRLLRFLLSLGIRLRLSVGGIAFALRPRFAAFWRSILTFARRRGQSQIPLHANDVPRAVVDNDPTGERLQISEGARVEEEDGGTLAALPVLGTAHWEDELSRYQALTPNHPNVSIVEFKATIPENASQRYKPRTVKPSSDPLSIPAGQKTLLSAVPQPPEGWKRYVHPEGSILFYHEGLRIFTESDTSRPQPKAEILLCATTLIQKAKGIPDVTLDELTEIVLNVDDDRICHYYFVDHKNRLLFWVDPIEPDDLDTNLQGISEHSHIRYLVESQYWSHCEYYPHNRTLPRKVFEDLRGRLNCAKTDMMTTDSSTSPFAQDELVAILDIVNSLKDDTTISDAYSIWVIARLMAFFTENQFLNFCGQPCARLNADTSLLEKQTWNRSQMFRVVDVFLFGSPSEHASRLQRVWVDGIIIQPRWKDFINRLTTELGRYTIFSTVMLAVNFSFLAVPGVVPPSGGPASAIQIIIYCSVVSTTGSIVFSFALLNVYSNPGLMDANPAAEVMKLLSQMKWGMACLATTHSLPIACLVWSIALFSVALAIQIFRPKEPGTVAALGAECLILVLFGLISYVVMRVFSKNDDVDDANAVAEDDDRDPSPTRSHDDAERGLA